MNATRPVYWSVRRELWEHRSLYFAPLAVAALVLFGFAIGSVTFRGVLRAGAALDPVPYSMAASAILLTSFIVAIFYCLDALHGERRDRSILFWKSLPVSDLTTVLSKASIPFVVLPLLVLPIVFAVQLVMLIVNTVILMAGSQGSAAALWTQPHWIQMSLAMVYGVVVHVLWYAPIYGWFLLLSGWARRATFLWAVLPPLAFVLFESIAFGTNYASSLIKYRLFGAMDEAFAVKGNVLIDRLAQLDPVRFLTAPGLWVGLIFAAGFLAAAVWFRRYREPI